MVRPSSTTATSHEDHCYGAAWRRNRRYIKKRRKELRGRLLRIEEERDAAIDDLPTDGVDQEDQDAAWQSTMHEFHRKIEPLERQLQGLDEMELRSKLTRWSIDAPAHGPDFLKNGRRALREGRRESIEWWVKVIIAPAISLFALGVATYAAVSKSRPIVIIQGAAEGSLLPR